MNIEARGDTKMTPPNLSDALENALHTVGRVGCLLTDFEMILRGPEPSTADVDPDNPVFLMPRSTCLVDGLNAIESRLQEILGSLKPI